jgi:Tfp pilus assembly protein PilF
LNIYKENFHEDEYNNDIATAFNNMGLVYVKKKDFENAAQCFTKAINILKQINEEFNSDILSIMNNLAGVYFQTKAIQ